MSKMPLFSGEMAGESPMVQVTGLTKHYVPHRTLSKPGRVVRAVDGVDFQVGRGEVFGLVGESGCGKSTLGRLLVRLLTPTSGTVCLEGQDVHGHPGIPERAFRQTVQMVFQDPYASLNPSFRTELSLDEAYRLSGTQPSGVPRRTAMESLMELVGLSRDTLERYPHQLSGGQRQRVAIARALATGARCLVLDEPVSALDVSIQSQILNLLIDLRQELGLTYVLISHDLGVISYICERVAVMYLGKIVEIGSTKEVLSRPRHPYTEGLIASLPDPSHRGLRSRPILVGDLPSPLNLPTGCRFHPRCRYATEECRQTEPALPTSSDGHQMACFHPVISPPRPAK